MILQEQFLVKVAPTDPRWLLRTQLIESIYYKKPRHQVTDGGCYCEAALCIPSLDIRLRKGSDGDKIESSYIASALTSNMFVQVNVTKPELALISNVALFSTSATILVPPTVRTTYFVEEDRYSVEDTAIDSFAISGIIVSSILLFVTLAKLVLFFVFNPHSNWK